MYELKMQKLDDVIADIPIKLLLSSSGLLSNVPNSSLNV